MSNETMTIGQARKWAYTSLVVGILWGFYMGHQYKVLLVEPQEAAHGPAVGK